jgi:hypothetical protein
LARLARIDPQLLAPVQHRSAQAQARLDPPSIVCDMCAQMFWRVL